jgi:hypothetical protein
LGKTDLGAYEGDVHASYPPVYEEAKNMADQGPDGAKNGYAEPMEKGESEKCQANDFILISDPKVRLHYFYTKNHEKSFDMKLRS